MLGSGGQMNLFPLGCVALQEQLELRQVILQVLLRKRLQVMWNLSVWLVVQVESWFGSEMLYLQVCVPNLCMPDAAADLQN